MPDQLPPVAAQTYDTSQHPATHSGEPTHSQDPPIPKIQGGGSSAGRTRASTNAAAAPPRQREDRLTDVAIDQRCGERQVSRIFDNSTDKQLGPHLLRTLTTFDSMDVAVGYFNLRGWSKLDEVVRNKVKTDRPVVRILIGMSTQGPQDETIDQLQNDVNGGTVNDADAEVARERRAELLHHLRLQLMRGIPSPADRVSLQNLRDRIADGSVELKVYTRRPLHGKTYVCHRVDDNTPIVGFVGSSNLTVPGLYSNDELNVDVTDYLGAKQLSEWFETKWVDRFSRPISDDLLALLDESWASKAGRPPYEVFLKVCFDLSQDVREGLAEYSVPREINDELLEYQKTAVKTLARRIMTRRGTMLGDVVGLGKTLTAIAVALMLREEHGLQPLIVCPKNLTGMWEEHLLRYDLHGRVVSYTRAARELPNLRRYGLVIVDESHTLRNDKRQDYIALQQYIQDWESKALLLTATPYNIRFLDVANQLGLYIGLDEDLGIQPSRALALNPRIADSVDGKTHSLRAFMKSDQSEDWKRLMGEHLVRRTRSFIQANHSQLDEEGREYLPIGEDGRFYFPNRVPVPLDHSFGATDPAARMADETSLASISTLRLPRYALGRYVSRTANPSDSEKQLLQRIERGRGQVAGFVRVNFYKRLSSCGFSFLVSIRRHIVRNRIFIYALENGLSIPTGTFIDAQISDDDDLDDEVPADAFDSDPGDLYQQLQRNSPSSVVWARSDLFTPTLLPDLRSDTSTLEGLLSHVGPWSTSADSKLQKLYELVETRHPNDKVLVFTEYKDTAEYVATALQAMGVAAVECATGQSEDATAIAVRFSPVSNSRLGQPKGSNVRVLIATDVLSEGQNLQDSHVVVNYDLPWAIIRLIQRAGRVDRIGQMSNVVNIYSFFHESVESVISLRQRIAQRLTANAEAFGSDEQFFGSTDETKAISDLYNGQLQDGEEESDVDAASLAFQRWQEAIKNFPEIADRVQRMPDMVDATRRARLTDASSGVACYVRTESGMDAFGFAAHGGDLRLLTGHEALRAFEAAPEEQGLPRHQDHDGSVKALVQGPLSKPETPAGRLRGVRLSVWRRLGGQLFERSPATEQALDALYQHPLTTEAERRLRSAIRSGAGDDDLAYRVTALHRDEKLVAVSRVGRDPIRVVSSMGVARE